MVAANRANVDATIGNFRAFSETLKTELPKLAEKLNALADRVDTVVAENREQPQGLAREHPDLSGRLRVVGRQHQRDHRQDRARRGDDRQAGQRRGDGQQPQHHAQVGRGRRREPEEHPRPRPSAGSWTSTSAPRRSRASATTTTRAAPSASTCRPPDSGSSASSSSTRRSGGCTTTTEHATVTYPDGHTETTLTEEQRGHRHGYTSTPRSATSYPRTSPCAPACSSRPAASASTRNLLKDRLRLSLEVYDFNRETKPPHLRLEGRYYLTQQPVRATPGWDDPAWTERSCVLFGGGVTWGDDDVKYLLGTAVGRSGADHGARRRPPSSAPPAASPRGKWLGRCPSCGGWNTFEAGPRPARPPAARARRRHVRRRSPPPSCTTPPALVERHTRASTACSAAASSPARSFCSPASRASASRRCCCRSRR